MPDLRSTVGKDKKAIKLAEKLKQMFEKMVRKEEEKNLNGGER